MIKEKGLSQHCEIAYKISLRTDAEASVRKSYVKKTATVEIEIEIAKYVDEIPRHGLRRATPFNKGDRRRLPCVKGAVSEAD